MPIIKNRIPDKGSVENMMQRLQSYIEPVDPEWVKNLKPASEESIKKWKKVLALEEKNLDFPSSYLEFLRYAGEGDGGLFEETLNAKMSLESQLSYYRSVDTNENDIAHPYCFDFMATTDLNLSYSINLGKENEKIFCDITSSSGSCNIFGWLWRRFCPNPGDYCTKRSTRGYIKSMVSSESGGYRNYGATTSSICFRTSRI